MDFEFKPINFRTNLIPQERVVMALANMIAQYIDERVSLYATSVSLRLEYGAISTGQITNLWSYVEDMEDQYNAMTYYAHVGSKQREEITHQIAKKFQANGFKIALDDTYLVIDWSIDA